MNVRNRHRCRAAAQTAARGKAHVFHSSPCQKHAWGVPQLRGTWRASSHNIAAAAAASVVRPLPRSRCSCRLRTPAAAHMHRHTLHVCATHGRDNANVADTCRTPVATPPLLLLRFRKRSECSIQLSIRTRRRRWEGGGAKNGVHRAREWISRCHRGREGRNILFTVQFTSAATPGKEKRKRRQ